MKTDRELLELAARAAGLDLEWCEPWKCMARNLGVIDGFDRHTCWNPLDDDGDALRLAVKLKLEVGVWFETTMVESDEAESIVEKHGSDPYAATRRAIVRAAAEIQHQKERNH